jgi:hypothetical protein
MPLGKGETLSPKEKRRTMAEVGVKVEKQDEKCKTRQNMSSIIARKRKERRKSRQGN